MMKMAGGVLALLLVLGGNVYGTTIGSIGFDTPLLTQSDAQTTGNINTATTFSLQSLATTNNENGIFAGLAAQNFGTVAFSPGMATSLNFGNAVFGRYQSSSITETLNTSGFLNLLLEGTYTPGSFEKGLSRSSAAELRMSFTQTPPMNGEISFSGTMSVTKAVAPVPEAPIAVLFLSGLGLLGAATKLRRNCSAAG